MRLRQWILRGGLALLGLALLGGAAWILSNIGPSGLGFGLLLLLAVIGLTSFPPEKTQDFIRRRLVLLVIVVMVAMSFATASSMRTGSVRFYEISAQVIPTLVLALAIEIRLIRGTARHEFALVFPFAILVLLGLGEFFALKAVVTESPTRTDFQNVVSTMTGAFVGIVLGALAGPTRRDHTD